MYRGKARSISRGSPPCTSSTAPSGQGPAPCPPGGDDGDDNDDDDNEPGDKSPGSALIAFRSQDV